MDNQPSNGGLKKEILIPLVVSIIGGIIVASYQFFLDSYKDQDTPTTIQQQIVVPPTNTTTGSNSTTPSPDAAIQQYIGELNENIEAAKRLLREKQCDEAKATIAKIVWERTELDEKHILALKFEKIKKNMEQEAALCGSDDALKAAEAALAPKAQRKAIETLRQKSRDIDFSVNNLELVEKKDNLTEDSYNITYTYKAKISTNPEEDKTVSVSCRIPIVDGKPGEGIVGNVD